MGAYTRFQQSVSILLITSILMLETVRIPFLYESAAASSTQTDIVSFIVDEDLYNSASKSKIVRYAEDIQGYLTDTRVLIFPVKKTINPHLIAALNERLYYQGDGQGLSRLVGTMLLGSVPLPVVHKRDKSFVSVFPYVDFEEKMFTYSPKDGYYEFSRAADPEGYPEIWHGVVTPNSGDPDSDRQKIDGFLDKTHEFYSRTNRFEAFSITEPYVFYFDGTGDQLSSSPMNWKAYKNHLANVEDITYQRYSKYLAQKLLEKYQEAQNVDLGQFGQDVKDALGSYKDEASSILSSPDIQSKKIIDKSAKQFFEILGTGYLSDIMKHFSDSGRYLGQSGALANIAPILVAKDDILFREGLYGTNTFMEDSIDAIVQGGLARNLPVLTDYTYEINASSASNGTSADGTATSSKKNSENIFHYKNYLFGRQGETITKANQCTIARGSTLLVEANQGFTVDKNLIQTQVETLTNDLPRGGCFSGGKPQTMTYWGGNSMLNLSQSSFGGGSGPTGAQLFKLQNNRYDMFVKPVFDITGSQEVATGSIITPASPVDCLKNNVILQPYSHTDMEWTRFAYPSETSGTRFHCKAQLYKTQINTFGEYYANGFGTNPPPADYPGYGGTPVFRQPATSSPSGESSSSSEQTICYVHSLKLNAQEKKRDFKQVGGLLGGTSGSTTSSSTTPSGGISCGNNEDYIIHSYTYDFKSVPSWVEHKSPTKDEILAQSKSMITPSLPADRDRYVDFVSAKGESAKIMYPNLFRVRLSGNDVSIAGAKAKLKEYLDAKSAGINSLIAAQSPAGLGGKQREVYDALKTGPYPTMNVDLYGSIAAKPELLEMVVQAVYWNNLTNATAKYMFLLEHYLDSDGNTLYPLPSFKKVNELAYLGSPGDAANMYIKIDPDQNGDAPKAVSDVQADIDGFRGGIMAINTAGSDMPSKSDTKCGPPDGVNLFQWLPAIFCWLGTILPPTISFWGGSCGGTTLGEGGGQSGGAANNAFTNPKYQEDANRNGINDGAELIQAGELKLSSDRARYGLFATVPLKAELLSGGKVINVDSYNSVRFDIQKITVAGQVVYQNGSTDPKLSNSGAISQYMNFVPLSIRAQSGISRYSMTSKAKAFEAEFVASIRTLDKDGRVAIDKKSAPLKVTVVSASSKITTMTKKEGTTEFLPSSSVTAGNPNGVKFVLSNPSRPLKLKVFDDVAKKQVAPETSVDTAEYVFKSSVLDTSGVYRFEFTDSTGLMNEAYVTVMPDVLTQIRVTPATNAFVAGSKTTVAVELLDRLGNHVQSTMYALKGEIVSGSAVFAQSNGKTVERSVIDGTASFDVTSRQAGEDIKLRFSVTNPNLVSPTETIQVLADAKVSLEVENRTNIVVGGDPHVVRFKVSDGQGNLLTNFKGVLSVSFPTTSGTLSKDFIRIEGGVSKEDLVLKPGFLAAKDVRFNVSVPGVSRVENDTVTVLPGVPMSVEMRTANPKIEAKIGSKTIVQAALHDRYGNLAYNHAPGYTIALSIPNEYENYVSFGGGSAQAGASFQEGRANVEVFATRFPGTSYVIGTVAPSLEANTVTYTDAKGNSATLKGLTKGLAMIDSYYLFNKEKVQNLQYNSLYTVLLGADYGNVTHEDYLGGELLFNPDSRSLAVTSLLNHPTRKETVFGFTPAGKYVSSAAADDVVYGFSHEFAMMNGKTAISFYDTFTKDVIARAWLNIDPSKTEFAACAYSNDEGFSGCSLPNAESYIVGKSLNSEFEFEKRDDSIALITSGIEVFRMNKDATYTVMPGITLELAKWATGNYTTIRLMSQGQPIGQIAIKFSSNRIEFGNQATNRNGSIVLENVSNRFAYEETYLGNSTVGAKGVSFFTYDSLIKARADRDLMGVGREGIELYSEKRDIGWSEKSKFLLDFVSAGSSVGEATRFFQTFSMVNLGDPVFQLNTQPKNFGYDRAIGKQLFKSPESITGYKSLDFDADGLKDFVVFVGKGKVRLFLNQGGRFRDMGLVAYMVDAGDSRKVVGDFERDGYWDIVFVDEKGGLNMLRNNLARLKRIQPRIQNAAGAVVTLRGKIVQLETYDMDQDGAMDLVTVDDSGELNILYASGTGDQFHFLKKTLDSGLGLTLDSKPRSDGGAAYFDGLPQLPNFGNQEQHMREMEEMPTDGSLPESVQKAMIDKYVYYQEPSGRGSAVSEYSTGLTQAERNQMLSQASGTNPETGQADPASGQKLADSIAELSSLNSPGMTDVSVSRSPTPSVSNQQVRTYVRSTFAEGKGLGVEKTYKDANGSPLQSGDKIQVTIVLKNLGASPKANLTYLDSNEQKVFIESDDKKYVLKSAGKEESRQYEKITYGEFDRKFTGLSIPAGGTITISYLMKSAPVSINKVIVGRIFKNDRYGDVSFNPNNTCGGKYIAWKSIAQRTYEKLLTSNGDTALPEPYDKMSVDADGNGQPDYIDEMTKLAKDPRSAEAANFAKDKLAEYQLDQEGIIVRPGDPLVKRASGGGGGADTSGMNGMNVDKAVSQINEVLDSLCNWFGNGQGCISLPINWAPLAPGSVPVAFGYPLGEPSVDTGLPIFSALTGMWYGPYCGPSVWPASILDLSQACTGMGAGGWLGVNSPANFFRLFITPTLSGSMGIAACFGGPASMSGKIPPPAVYPLASVGGCVFATKPLAGCKEDGSDDGRVSFLNLSATPFTNMNSCRSQNSATGLTNEEITWVRQYAAGNTSMASKIQGFMARGSSFLSNRPVVGIGNGSGNPDFEIAIDTEALKNFDFGNIVKINLSKVTAFPDFIMDWVSRQIEEIVNKLTSLPTLYIILPDMSGIQDSYEGMMGKLEKAYKAGEDKYQDKNLQNTSQLSNGAAQSVQGAYNSAAGKYQGDINSMGRNVSGIKNAYEMLSNLPLIQFQNQQVDITIPWMSPEELDRWITGAKAMANQWRNEIDTKTKAWASLGTASGLDRQVSLDAGALLSSLEQNIQIVEEYRRFPEKLMKYLTWKDRYITQILCNVEMIEKMLGGWLADNGRRFKAWVELYIVIKALLKSWQVLIDLFTGYEAQCAPCKRNERYNMKYWMFKLVSAFLPKIPVIQFPKWPDIILDLHYIRAGLRVSMPVFNLNTTPIVLPTLPRLTLPGVPSAGLHLPALPLLPRIPELPDLPDLPSLPTIKLPDLPPPPKIPKLFGGIAAVLNILKLVRLVLCIYEKGIGSFMAPEWYVGEKIAEASERTGPLPFDFINISFPNLSLSFVDAIKVSTFVNLEFEIDFIVQMARATLNPFNQMSANLANMGNIQISDINVASPVPSRIDVNVPGPRINGVIPTKNGKPISAAQAQDRVEAKIQELSKVLFIGFIDTLRYMEAVKNDNVTLDTFKSVIDTNLKTMAGTTHPVEREVMQILTMAVAYDAADQNEYLESVRIEQEKRFANIKAYLQAERADTVRLSKEVQAILESGSPGSVESLIGAENGMLKIAALNSSPLVAEYRDRVETDRKKSLARIQNAISGKDEMLEGLKAEGESLKSKAHETLLALVTDKSLAQNYIAGGSIPTQGGSSSSSTYSNAYRGVYVVEMKYDETTKEFLRADEFDGINMFVNGQGTRFDDPNATIQRKAKQGRLFEYTDEIQGSEDIVFFDSDNDKDADVIYQMENSIFYKENKTNNPAARHIGDEPQEKDLATMIEIPSSFTLPKTAPNYFAESIVAANQISFSFAPADQERDTKFRAEFYDQITRFDNIDKGMDRKTMQPESSFHAIDLAVDMDKETLRPETFSGMTYRSQVAYFSNNGQGEGILKSKKFRLLTPTSAMIIIGAGRQIHVSGDGAKIRYRIEDDAPWTTADLARNTVVEFDESVTVDVSQGGIYLFDESMEEKTVNLADLDFFPILPGTMLTIKNKWAEMDVRYHDGSLYRMDMPVTYEFRSLGQPSKDYSVSVNRENGWYYSRLYSFREGKEGTKAVLTLLSPQLEADKEGPLLAMDSVIRMPVYRPFTKNFSRDATDLSGIREFYVDADLQFDTDGDGDTKNDRDSLLPNGTGGVKKGNSLLDVTFGAYTTIFQRPIRIISKDINGNVSTKDVKLTSYAPIPQIAEVQSGTTVRGAIDEKLADEPIHVIRMRNGVISIVPANTTSLTNPEGGFRYGANGSVSSEVAITDTTGRKVASIDEKTGKITLLDATYQTRVTPASQDAPMRIELVGSDGKVAYTQSFSLSKQKLIVEERNISQATATGIFVQPTDGYRFVKNTNDAPSLPGGWFIIDGDSKPVAGVGLDGNIYLLDSRLRLNYSVAGDYVTLRIVSGAGAVADVLYRFQAEFVLK